MSSETHATAPVGWALVEIMGHVRLAGYVSEQAIAGGALVKVDVPDTVPHDGADDQRPTPAYTRLFGVQSIYSITPCDEQTARGLARQIERQKLPWQPRPLALTAGPSSEVAAESDEYDYGDDDDEGREPPY